MVQAWGREAGTNQVLIYHPPNSVLPAASQPAAQLFGIQTADSPTSLHSKFRMAVKIWSSVTAKKSMNHSQQTAGLLKNPLF